MQHAMYKVVEINVHSFLNIYSVSYTTLSNADVHDLKIKVAWICGH
jgi:hypothetical protein